MPSFAPDGRTIAFLSDRASYVDADDGHNVSPRAGRQPADPQQPAQIHVLPLDGGEAHRLTDLPRGVESFEWSPDGSRLVAVSASRGATPEEDARLRGTQARRADGS